MDLWYRIVTPREEVREGRSFNPDEFAIALERVVAGKTPDDYSKPDQFFARQLRPSGLEPLTFGSVDRCSIQLS